MENSNKRLCGQIRFIRELQGYSQESVASHLGISQQAYQKIESGRCKACKERLQLIAHFLGVDLKKLEEVDKEQFLAPIRQEGSSSIMSGLKKEVLSMKKELKRLRMINNRILAQIENVY